EDLYFRLNSAILTLPPLRERHDLEWLIEKMLVQRRIAHKRAFSVAPDTMARLRQHDWPGNVRELVNALDYACAMTETGLIEIEDLPESLAEPGARKEPHGGPQEALLNDLRRHGWNISQVARLRGVDRTTIHRQIRRFGLADKKLQHD
ncbi:MAG: helix-turn-helix domain-containing protein, partial [Alphaproteobacteria bacterium]|nr:helix-turn-helix domain-containing protein [Alphaproteobacteria bacterium]